MIILYFYQWWFTDGWKRQFKQFLPRLSDTADTFSITILLRTLFKPWKQIISSSGVNHSLSDYFKAFLDNLVSRLVGFMMRFFVLLAGLIFLAITSVISIAVIIIWPFIPALPLVVIFLSLGAM